MADERPITELLNKVKQGELDAAGAILEHFWEVARQTAHRNLSAKVRSFQSGSDIANAAFRSAFSHLGKPVGTVKPVVRNRDEFEELVLLFVRRKAKSAGRFATAVKRDVRRLKPLPEEGTQGGTTRRKEPTPDELAKAGELGKRIEKIIMQEPKKLMRGIGLLGVLGKLNTAEIRAAFAAEGSRVPAERTVQKGVQLAKERVAAALEAEFGKLLPEKKEVKKKAKKTPAPHKSKASTKKASKKGSIKKATKKSRTKGRKK